MVGNRDWRVSDFAIEIPVRSNHIVGSPVGSLLVLVSMVRDSSETCRLESGFPRLADGRALSFVLVVRRDVADAGVEPHPVPARADHVELGSQYGGIGDALEVRGTRP
jgi:hypothetical protein